MCCITSFVRLVFSFLHCRRVIVDDGSSVVSVQVGHGCVCKPHFVSHVAMVSFSFFSSELTVFGSVARRAGDAVPASTTFVSI